MPGRDGTGPAGNGPMTGWGTGYCMTSRPLGFGRGSRRGMGRRIGRGLGFGPGAGMGAWYGCGRGFGRLWWNQDMDADPVELAKRAKAEEREILEEERTLLQKRLDMINAQLDNETNEE